MKRLIETILLHFAWLHVPNSDNLRDGSYQLNGYARTKPFAMLPPQSLGKYRAPEDLVKISRNLCFQDKTKVGDGGEIRSRRGSYN